MTVAAILLGAIVILLLYMGNRYLKDLRGIRQELAEGRTLRELSDMVNDTRDELLSSYDEMTEELDRKIERLERLNKDAETTAGRLDGLLQSERLKTLEERGILFAIDVDKEKGEKEKHKRIADLLRGGASIEEVSRITETSVREVELVRLLIRRRDEERA